jgi:hypothetical protein
MSKILFSEHFVITTNAKKVFSQHEIIIALTRHLRCEWGDLCSADKKANDEALKTGARILSSYNFSDGRRCWIITDATDDRGVRHCTTILLPEDY